MIRGLEQINPKFRPQAIAQLLGSGQDDNLFPLPESSGPESVMQGKSEEWAENQRGFWRLTQENIKNGPPPRGWFGHIQRKNSKGMFILLDLLFLSVHPPFRWLQIELKPGQRAVRKHQAALIAQPGPTFLATTGRLYVDILDEWEDENRRLEEMLKELVA